MAWMEKRAWHEGTTYLIVLRMENHHHRANYKTHKEPLLTQEEFKYCRISEESHHGLVIIFPAEVLARDDSIIWQGSMSC